MALTVDETLYEIEQLHRKNPAFDHPLYTEIVEGTLNREQLKEGVRQNGIIPLYNHYFHGRLYVICPEPPQAQA